MTLTLRVAGLIVGVAILGVAVLAGGPAMAQIGANHAASAAAAGCRLPAAAAATASIPTISRRMN